MKNLSFLLWGSLIFLASCSGSSSAVIPVPKEAAQVININTSTLSSHLTIEELFETNVFKNLEVQIKDSSTLNILKNPGSSGLNTDKNFTIFTTYQSNRNVIALGGFIANKDQLENMVSTHIGSPIESKGFKYAMTDHVFIGWNDDVAIQGTILNAEFNMESASNFGGIELTEANAIAFLEFYFNAKGKDLINGEKHFKEALALGGDIQTYQNSTYAMTPYQMFLSMSKIGDFLKGNYTISNVNFENGKVTAKNKTYLNDHLKKLAKKHIKNHVDLSALSNFNGEEVIAGMAMELSPEFFVDLLKEVGMEGMVNSFLQQNGLSLDDLAKAFGQNMFLGLSGFNVFGDGNSYREEPVGAFGLQIKDKDVFKKIMNVFHQQGANVFDSTLVHNDKYFVIASSQVLGNSILEGKGNELNEYAKHLKNKSGGFFVDVEKLLTKMQGMSKKDEDKEVMQIFQKYLKGGYANFEIEGGDFVGHAQFDLKVNDKSSLEAFVDMFDEIYVVSEKNKKHSVDSLDNDNH